MPLVVVPSPSIIKDQFMQLLSDIWTANAATDPASDTQERDSRGFKLADSLFTSGHSISQCHGLHAGEYHVGAAG